MLFIKNFKKLLSTQLQTIFPLNMRYFVCTNFLLARSLKMPRILQLPKPDDHSQVLERSAAVLIAALTYPTLRPQPN